jgi:diguanylate cyclase (GGDEF)-like protein/PAS domain S-box-containing protein
MNNNTQAIPAETASKGNGALFEHHPDGIFQIDPEGRIVEVNPAAVRMSGRSRAELVNRPLDAVAAPERVQPDLEHFRAAMQGETRVFESKGLRGDGSLFDVQIIAMPRLQQGQIVGAYAIVKDINAQHRAQAELAASEARFRALYRHSMDAILLSDPTKGHMLACNPAAERLFGRSEAELKALHREQVFDTRDPALAEFIRQRDAEGHARGMLRAFQADGTPVPVDATTALFTDENGNTRSSVILRDMSEQLRHEEELRESEARYRALFERNMDAVFLSEADSRQLIAANPAAQALMGMSEAAVCARPPGDALDLDDPAARRYFEDRDRHGRAWAKLRMKRGDGTWFTAEISSQVFHDADGRRLASTIIRDITEQEAYQEQLRESEERYRIVTRSTEQAVYELDLSDRSIVWAGAHEVVFGVNSEAIRKAPPRQRVRYIAPEDRDRVVAAFHEAYQHGGPYRIEYALHLDDGRVIEVDDRGVVMPERNRVYGVIRDVTEHKRLLRSLAEQERQLRLMAAAFSSSEEAMLICNPHFVIREVNHAYERLVGVAREQAIGSTPTFLEIGRQSENVQKGVEQHGFWRGELMHYRADGGLLTSRASVTVMDADEGNERSLVVNFQDISRLREYERQVDYLSYHDALTGLPNRIALGEWFERHKATHPDDGALTLAYLDLDRFRAINETFGHSAGDALLVEIAHRLQDTCARRDYVVRVGGDDFVIMLPGVADRETAQDRVDALQQTIAHGFDNQGRTLYTTASVGICLFPAHGRELEELLRRADAAHAQAKARGRGTSCLYHGDMQSRVERQARIEQHLREAIRADAIQLQYQPVVDLADGRITGLEALARWTSPELGEVPPSEFIPVAEQTGLIVELGDRILDLVCAKVRAWRDGTLDAGRVAVNLSPIQFQQPDLVNRIRGALARHGVGGRWLRIEITENVLMVDPERATCILEQLHDLGIETAMDDFGTGYSSMAYLKKFPVHYIKLDRTFIAGLPGNNADLSIVSSVVGLAREFGIKVVAEGIENAAQRTCLRELGCDQAQGFYFCLPLDPDDVAPLLEGSGALPQV